MKHLLPLCVIAFLSCTKSDQPSSKPQIEMGDQAALSSIASANADEAITLTPVADATIRSSQYADENYGTETSLVVKGSATSGFTRYSFLKFSLSDVSNISSATLRVYGYNTENEASIKTSVYGVDADNWTESNVTWDESPDAESSTPLSSVGITDEATYYELDVTDYVKEQAAGDNTASFVLKNPTKQNKKVLINSRTSNTNRPQLIISTATNNTDYNDKPDHIFIVWEENKGFNQIIGSSSAPFINSLAAKGTLFTKAHGITHPSYPNYIHFFAGQGFGIGSNDCISGSPYSAQNIYTALKAAGKSFAWYSEGLPSAGSGVCSSGQYREKHNPTTIFSNVPDEANLPLTSLNLTDASTFKNLPDVVCVTPNMINDMHDGTIKQGDDWLKAKFSKLIDWCMENNSVFIVYYDEDNGEEDNRIPVIAVGENVKAGYKETRDFDHYSFTKLVLDCNDADVTFHSNVKNAPSIKNIWK